MPRLFRPAASLAAAALGAAFVLPLGAQSGGMTLAQRAEALMAQVPLVDGHNDIPWAMREKAGYDFEKLDLRTAQPTLHTDIPRLRRGKVGAQFWSAYVPATLQGEDAVTATLEQIAAVYELVRRYPDTFEIAGSAADIERIFRAGRIASLAGLEGGHSIDASLGALRMFHRLGARYMTLTHSSNVPWADSATDTPKVGGLSPFGEEVVREMNWLGMLVDLSHVSPDTMRDAIRVSEAPVIFSHSSARAICDVPRNVPDDVLALVKANGGIVMITFVPGFVSPATAAYWQAQREETQRIRSENPNASPEEIRALLAPWTASHPEPKATLAMVADHIDHVRQVAGVDHVGLGGDFDGIDYGPDGLEDVSKYPDLVAELLRRGYSDEDVGKILGRNILRVMRQAEQVATRLQASRGPSIKTLAQLDGVAATVDRR